MGPLLEPPPLALRGPGVAFPGILREVWKGYWNWNYTLQKKGRDLELEAGVVIFEIPSTRRANSRG